MEGFGVKHDDIHASGILTGREKGGNFAFGYSRAPCGARGTAFSMRWDETAGVCRPDSLPVSVLACIFLSSAKSSTFPSLSHSHVWSSPSVTKNLDPNCDKDICHG
jgi:hypothetical protein